VPVMTSQGFYRAAQIVALLMVPVGLLVVLFFKIDDKIITHGLVESQRQAVLRSKVKDTVVKAVHKENGDPVARGELVVELADLQGWAKRIDEIELERRRLREEYARKEHQVSRDCAQLRQEYARQAEETQARIRTLEDEHAQAERQAELDERSLRAEFERAKEQAELKRERLENEYKRMEELYKSGSFPGNKLEEIAYELKDLEVSLKKQEEQTEYEIRKIEAKLEQTKHRTDNAIHEAQVALDNLKERTEEEVRKLEDDLAKLKEATDLRVDEIDVTTSRLAEQLNSLTVTAPFAGHVVNVFVEPSESVSIGTDLVSITGEGEKIIRCLIPEHQRVEMEPGLPVMIKSEYYNYLRFDVYSGEVASVSRYGKHKQMLKTPMELPPRSDILYEVIVRINEDEDEQRKLQVGSEAQCEIIVRQAPIIMVFLERRR